MNEQVTIGLYRHFKGAFYFVQSIVKDCTRGNIPMCHYFNILHPEYGNFVRPVSEWFSTDTEAGEIISRIDNRTGQRHRFEKVYSLDDGTANLTTEHLIRVLAERADSPLQQLDIEGLSSRCLCSDYIVGDVYYATEDHPTGVETVCQFDTEESAKKYYSTHMHRQATKVFKRTFIEVE